MPARKWTSAALYGAAPLTADVPVEAGVGAGAAVLDGGGWCLAQAVSVASAKTRGIHLFMPG